MISPNMTRRGISFPNPLEKILSNALCCGCGACVGVCSNGALAINIFISYEPVFDNSKCVGCGLCYDVCPGQGYPVVQWAKQHCVDQSCLDPERGPVRQCLIGHSTDPDIRLNSSSGGIATSLLLHQLESGLVDSVLVVGMENERPVSILTNDPKDVRDAMMSKYGPVPLLANLIPELRKHPRRIAMTVTPCQLGGWLRAVEKIPELRKSTVLALGLFCGHIQTYEALTSIAATLGLRYPEEAKFIAWRYGQYPGFTRFERTDGSIVEKTLYTSYDIAIPHFSLNRCFLCPDGGNWLADITLGDFHKLGTDETVIVCRTEKGQEALELAQKSGCIELERLTTEQVTSCSIHGITRSKMLPAIARNAWLKKKGQVVPELDYDDAILLRDNSRIMICFWIWKYRLTCYARTNWRRKFLQKHPFLLEKVGHFLYVFPTTLPGWRSVMLLMQLIRKINSNYITYLQIVTYYFFMH